MTSFNDNDPASDQALKQMLDFDVDEARIASQTLDRIANTRKSALLVDWLQNLILSQPRRVAAIGLFCAFMIGFAIPLDPVLFGDHDLIRLALGDTAYVMRP